MLNRLWMILALVVPVAAQTLPAPPDAAKIAALETDMKYSLPSCEGAIMATTKAEFSAALANVTSGGVICTTSAATFKGKFYATKTNANWVTVRSVRADELAVGKRIDPLTDAAKLTKIVSSDSGQALFVTARATKWRFVGLEFTTASASHNLLVRLGANGCVYPGYCQNSVADIPQRIVMDRCWVHGLTAGNSVVGVSVNADYVVIRDSVIDDIHTANKGDTQAISSSVAQGPMIFQNNKLEAAGENVMFGGDTAMAYSVVPSDVIFRGNHFWKNPARRADLAYPVKNIFELKTGRRILLEGNVFENDWSGVSSQYFPVVMKTANQGCTTIGANNQVADIIFRYNLFQNIPQGFAIGRVAACDYVMMGSTTFHIHDNLFLGFGSGHTYDGHPKLIQPSYPELLPDGTREHARYMTIEHNTVATLTKFGINAIRYIHTEGTERYVRDFTFRSNVVAGNWYTLGTNNNETKISAVFLPVLTVKNNLIVGAKAVFANAPNFQRTDYSGLFINAAGGNYALATPASYPGHDGRPAGADIAKVNACTSGVKEGTWGGC